MRPTRSHAPRRSQARQRGAAILIAMMFLVIFASLATAMAIVAEGNLRTADSHLKLNRCLAAAESGLQFVNYHIESTLAANAAAFTISEGEISDTQAGDLWDDLRVALEADLSGAAHNFPGYDPGDWDGALRIGPIAAGVLNPATSQGDNQLSIPRFYAVIAQHPITPSTSPNHPFYGHSYDSPYYDRAPFDGSQPESGITAPVSDASPLTPQWIRVKVVAVDGPFDGDTLTPLPGSVTRSLSMDFKLTKRIRAAVLSRSRVMIGKNVMIEGRIGSTFGEVDLENGHPVQMESDFRGLDATLDGSLDALIGSLIDHDANGDNRLQIATEVPATERATMASFDYDGDGYVSDWDLFFDHYDSNGDYQINATELGADTNPRAAELLRLIDGFHDDDLAGDVGVIDFNDRYTKIKGEVVVAASREDWEGGAAAGDSGTGSYRDYFQGPITPRHGDEALSFSAGEDQFPDVDAESFNVDEYRAMADAPLDLTQQSEQVREAVPYGSAHPYDYYDRPVFEGITYTNLYIPKGTNALFKDCTFIGVTYIEVDHVNNVPYSGAGQTVNGFNYAGMQEADGTPKHPDIDAVVGNTKSRANNIRFDGCTFKGAVVSGPASGAPRNQPETFSHTRNKLTFTGDTRFVDMNDTAATAELSDEQRRIFRRGAIIAPQHSVEMGTFVNPSALDEAVNLSGAVVAGVLDMRGQIEINGTIITTFEPVSNDPTGPVLGETSPQFNTTLGYFSSAAGDLEAELPSGGLGLIKVKYNPNLPLPNGVKARISVEPLSLSYYEGGLTEPRLD